MNIGLFFGSFNPIHVGHLIIANTVVELSQLHQVWFVVSPHNPFKKKANLLHEFDRYDMVRHAITDNTNLNVSDIEFHLPKPSYTATTLAVLAEKHPKHNFKVIMGGDNLKHFHKWKNYKVILEQYGVIVYPRPGDKLSLQKLRPEYKDIEMVEAPLMEISATLIRRLIRDGKSIRYLVPDEVSDYIEYKKLYK